jgi:hypothetical protein
MSKKSKPFTFTYLHTQKVIRDCKYVDQITELIVKGVGYCDTSVSRQDIEERYDFDLNSIEGMTPLEILQSEVSLDKIHEEALQAVSEMFDAEPSDLFKQMARVAYSGYVPKERLDEILGE